MVWEIVGTHDDLVIHDIVPLSVYDDAPESRGFFPVDEISDEDWEGFEKGRGDY